MGYLTEYHLKSPMGVSRLNRLESKKFSSDMKTFLEKGFIETNDWGESIDGEELDFLDEMLKVSLLYSETVFEIEIHGELSSDFNRIVVCDGRVMENRASNLSLMSSVQNQMLVSPNTILIDVATAMFLRTVIETGNRSEKRFAEQELKRLKEKIVNDVTEHFSVY